MLAYIDPEGGPQIAYDDDSLAAPLVAKVKEAVGEYQGSQGVFIAFNNHERALYKQFQGIAQHISGIFAAIGNV